MTQPDPDRMTVADLPMGGCSTSAAHFAHLDAGDPRCENQRETEQEPDEWDPSQHVSYSSLTLHRQCPQAWSYRYLRGLSRVGPASARSLGSWWHMVRAFDYIRRGLDLGSLRSAPAEVSSGDGGPVAYRVGYDPHARIPMPAEGRLYRLGEKGSTFEPSGEMGLMIAAAYWKRLSGDERDWWVEEIGEHLPDRLAYMDARWRERWDTDLRHEAPLGVEVKFKRPVPGTERAVLPGYIDVVYLDTRRNLVVVRDSKTSKTLDASDSGPDLSDSQLHLYVWGAQPLIEEWGHGPVRALSYDRVRSSKPKAPSLTQAGALSKSVTDYDLHTYLAFVGDGLPYGEDGSYYASGAKKGQPKFGTYEVEQAVVDRLSSPAAMSVWHQRTLVPLNRNVIRAHLQSVQHTQQEAERTVAYFREHGEASRNFHRRLCGWCDFAALCRAEMMGGPSGSYPLDQFGLTEVKRR